MKKVPTQFLPLFEVGESFEDAPEKNVAVLQDVAPDCDGRRGKEGGNGFVSLGGRERASNMRGSKRIAYGFLALRDRIS